MNVKFIKKSTVIVLIVTDDHDRCAAASANDGHRSRSYLGGQIWIVVDNKTMRKNA